MTHLSAEIWRDRLGLDRHPEGGWFRRVYASAGMISQTALPAAFHGPRPFGSAIYYLLEAGDICRLHRIASDEIWHHYHGAEVELVELDDNGRLEVHRLGKDPRNGALPFRMIPAGNWFGARPSADTGDYALLGCTVIPGFDFAEHEMGRREQLLNRFPQHREWITHLTSQSGEPH